MNGRNIPYIFRGRNLTLPRGETAIQIALTGDNLSNRITFVLDRVYNGVDLSAYEPQLLLKGTFMNEPQEDTITLTTGLTKAINGTTIEVVWTVGSTQTYQNGTGTAQIRFVSSSAAVWHSNIFNVSVGSSLSVDGSAEEHDPSVIVDHTARILALETEIVDKVDKDGDKVLTDNNLTDALKASYDDAVTKAHTHTNKSTLDNITAAYTAEEKAKLAGVDENINARMTAVESGKIDTSVIDTDNNLTANDNNKIASQRAVKTYIDTKFRTKDETYTKSEIEALICNATYVVDTYAEMLAIDNPKNMVSCFVRDASADPTVTSGAAFYKYDKENPSGATWIKLFESEGIDVIQTAANVTVISRSAPYNVANQELLNTAIIGQVENKANTADLKPHAFNDLATSLGTETDKAPTNKLLNDIAEGSIRPNMLINSNFAINTLGKSVYDISSEPACDGWEVVKGGGAYYNATTKTLHCLAGGDYAWLRQRMTWIDLTKLIGKTITMTVRCKASRNKYVNIGYYRVTSYTSLIQYSSTTVDSDFATVTVKTTIPDTVLATDIFCPRIYCNVPSSDPSGTSSLQLEWAKLEIGEYATEYQPPIEGEEFAKVKRYLDKADISTVAPISSAAASNAKVYSEKLAFDQLALKAPLANPTFTGTVTVPTPVNDTDAATKGYADSVTAYDKVIRTQDEFEELIDDPDWLGATSVALVGQFTYDAANNSGIKIPDAVRQIHGFNRAKITITNFKYDSTTAKGGLWYNTRPKTPDYSIRDLEVDCTGTETDGDGYGFRNCTNLTNCTGTGTGTWGFGFYSCTNLTNCTGAGTGSDGFGFGFCTNLTDCTGTGTGTGSVGYGFSTCTNLTNCTGKGTGTGSVCYGFGNCTNLTNCTGAGTGKDGFGFNTCTNLTNCTGTGTGTANGYGFFSITYASNCKDGGSSTNMWGGTNKNIDLDTCCKTLVPADNSALNT